jgi:hypothetical protein
MARRPPRWARAIAGTVGLLIIISACSIPSRPAWWPKPKHHAPTSSAPGTGQTTVDVVTDPWHAGMRQLGIQVYWTDYAGEDSAAIVRANSARIINYAISLNANSIAVTFPFFTYGITSDKLYAGSETPTPDQLAIFLAQAAKSHLRVTVRPILNENVLVAQNPIAWRGIISPANIDAWFRSYRRLLLPYARVAQSGGAATFVVGTELDSLEPDPNWSALVSSIRSVYRGQLLYDENFNEFAEHDANLPLATFGVDAYPRFDLSDSATVGRLTSEWVSWLGTHTPAIRHRAILSEVGIDAVAGSYSDPGAWLSTMKSPIDLVVQTKWYEAVCRAVTAEQIGGIYWWEVNFDADPADPGPFQTDRLTFLGRPAQQVIRSCFASLAGEVPWSN